MRPTRDGDIIFEGTLEARVAAQILNASGKAELIEGITPPIKPASIGWWEFVAMAAREEKGQGDTTEYTCPVSIGQEVLRTLTMASELAVPSTEPVISRKRYMGRKIVEFTNKIPEILVSKSNTIEVGGLIIVGASNETVSLFKRREAVINSACAERGWDVNSLSLEQVLEIRKIPEWKNPPELN